MGVCQSGQPIPDSIFCRRFIESVRMTACVICASHWEASHCIACVTASVSVIVKSRLLSTFCRPTHIWRSNANSLGLKTPKWAMSSEDMLPNYIGFPSSHQPDNKAWSSHWKQKLLLHREGGEEGKGEVAMGGMCAGYFASVITYWMTIMMDITITMGRRVV